MQLVYNSHQQVVFAAADDFDAATYDWSVSLPATMTAESGTPQRIADAMTRDARGEADAHDLALADQIGKRIIRQLHA